jgi:two-component system, LuxR family, response regulator FixJ
MNSEAYSEIRSGSGPPYSGRERCRNVFIVDDDEAVCDALTFLFGNTGYTVTSFTRAESLLDVVNRQTMGVLILDLFITDMSGLTLQDKLRNRGIALKTIFISGAGDIDNAVQAIKGGAIDFIEKPYTNKQLLDSVEVAMGLVNDETIKRQQEDTLEKRYQRLTSREREVMSFLAKGVSSRKLAVQLGLSSRTVEIHRAKIMHKLEVTSLPDLVRILYTNGKSRPEEVLIDIRQSLRPQEDQNND